MIDPTPAELTILPAAIHSIDFLLDIAIPCN
jgi:hypothetical protein